MGFKAYSKAGKCRSGQDSAGVVNHALPDNEDHAYRFTKALCGAQPQGRSAGWTSCPQGPEFINCPKCLKSMKNPVYQVLFEPDEDGWLVVSVPLVQGCRTQAKSIEQGLERIREALTLYVEEPFDLEVIEEK